jgi:hypothetical protein
MKTKTLSVLPALLLGLGLLACSGDASNDVVEVSGATPLFPDFSFDSGLQPAGSPVQASFKASVGGEMRVSARAGAKDGKGVASSGKLAIELHTSLEGKLKVSSGLVKYDGPIPGLDDIDVPIAGEVPFDPFLLEDGEEASLDAPVPPTDLPPIPLDGVGVPGTLTLTVKDGSAVHATLHGSCVEGSGGKATFDGETQTSGTIVLGATVKLDLPAPLNQEVTLPDMTIELPSSPGTISAEGSAAGIGDFRAGACAASDGDADGDGADDDGDADPSSADGDPASSGDAAGTCGGAEQKGSIVRYQDDYTSAPMPAGGKISDGTYVLTAVRGYGAPSIAEDQVRSRETLVLSDGTFRRVSEHPDDGKGPIRTSGRYDAQGFGFTFGYECPSKTPWEMVRYTSTGDTLVLFNEADTVAMTFGKL